MLSKVAVFLEAVASDENVCENGEYGAFIEDITRTLMTIMCELEVFMMDLGLPIEVQVQRNVMPEIYRSPLDQTTRYMRDYIIFRDLSYLYSELISLYQDLIDGEILFARTE